MSDYSYSMTLCKRSGPYGVHPRYGQVYKRLPNTEHDYVLINGQLYMLDDEDLVQWGQIQTVQFDMSVSLPFRRTRIKAEDTVHIPVTDPKASPVSVS